MFFHFSSLQDIGLSKASAWISYEWIYLKNNFITIKDWAIYPVRGRITRGVLMGLNILEKIK
jgi:hypothetical protein